MYFYLFYFYLYFLTPSFDIVFLDICNGLIFKYFVLSGSEVNFMQFRILGLMEKAASSITLEDILRKHQVPSDHAYSMKNVVDTKMSLGKVEVSIEVRVVKISSEVLFCKYVILIVSFYWFCIIISAYIGCSNSITETR